MNQGLGAIFSTFNEDHISSERKEILHALINYIKGKHSNHEIIRLNFICTHNSRRSHLSQVWAQTAAHFFGIQNLFCYSGGTEATSLFPKVAETLENQGFDVIKLSESTNPFYAIKFDKNVPSIICFSKIYNHSFNPQSHYAAVITCDAADEACPTVFGAEARIPVKYEDPKAYDGTKEMNIKYTERSLQIGEEMWYVFSKI
jgi:arsenate reductase (thioredoxin)